MLGRLRTVFGGGEGRGTPDTYSECRRCGRSVEVDTRMCPYCGTDAIARYEFS